jgi:hypothetical protein
MTCQSLIKQVADAQTSEQALQAAHQQEVQAQVKVANIYQGTFILVLQYLLSQNVILCTLQLYVIFDLN